jgi:UDP-N-acetyl-D-galactosamine dehydrogenase
VKDSGILVLGITFKENCTDIRNSKAVDVVKALQEYGARVTVCDPWANPGDVKREYGLEVLKEIPAGTFDAVVRTVSHREFADLNVNSKVFYAIG